MRPAGRGGGNRDRGGVRGGDVRAGGDRGSASVWVVACCALLMAVAAMAAVRAAAVLARHRAEAAADLAALAAAGRLGTGSAPCPAAARVAAGNRAELRTCRVHLGADGRTGVVDVVVRVGVRLPVVGRSSVAASARAGRLGKSSGPAFSRRPVWERPPCGMLARGSPLGCAALEAAGRRPTGR